MIVTEKVQLEARIFHRGKLKFLSLSDVHWLATATGQISVGDGKHFLE